MNDLIEQLKHNQTPNKWLTDEQRAKFEEVGFQNCIYLDLNGEWQKAYCHLWPNDVIRIHEDYKPEPEIEWHEVKKKGASIKYHGGAGRWGLQGLYEEPNWTGLVKYADGTISRELRREDTENPKGPAEYPKFVGFVKE